MILTYPLGHLLRDKLNRVIRRNDYAIWTNKKYGTGLNVVAVIASTPQKVKIRPLESDPNSKPLVVSPDNIIIITSQIEANLEGNVGAVIELEETR